MGGGVVCFEEEGCVVVAYGGVGGALGEGGGDGEEEEGREEEVREHFGCGCSCGGSGGSGGFGGERVYWGEDGGHDEEFGSCEVESGCSHGDGGGMCMI